jgi:hypothetical protein
MAEKYTKDTIESLEDYLLNFTDIAIDVYNKYHLEINKTQSIYPATVNNLDILFKRPSDFLKMRKKNKLRLDKKFFYVKSEDDIYTMDKDELLNELDLYELSENILKNINRLKDTEIGDMVDFLFGDKYFD